MKRDSLHQRSFARARRSTLVADLPRSFDESHELSRLSASSAQIISFSSSDKFSRLSKSLPAKRARSLGTSFRTAASISFMLIGDCTLSDRHSGGGPTYKTELRPPDVLSLTLAAYMSGYLLKYHQWCVSDPVLMPAYREAIRQIVRPGDIVLDLGAGSGTWTSFLET